MYYEYNAYGYTNNMNTNPNDRVNISNPNGQTQDVVVCDRHTNTTGLGHIHPTGKGHTEGGTTGAVPPNIDHGKYIVVHKDYVLDYTDPLKSVIIETEGGEGNLTYRYVYGLERAHVVIYGITSGAGSIIMYGADPDASIVDYQIGESGELEYVTEASFYLSDIMEYYNYNVGGAGGGMSLLSTTGIVKFHYHHDRLGSTDYLSDNVSGDVRSYVTYDDWGVLTAKAVLNTGVRELDLVQQYTVHPLDMVLEAYFAQARMYDAQDRRFMAVDPIKGAISIVPTLVKYQYTLNNPLRFIDPLGLADKNPIDVLSNPSNFSNVARVEYEHADYYNVAGVIKELGGTVTENKKTSSTTLSLTYGGMTANVVYCFDHQGNITKETRAGAGTGTGAGGQKGFPK